MHVGPSHSHGAAAANRAHGNTPATAAEPQAPTPSASRPAASAITGHITPMATGATAVNTQILASMETGEAAMPGKSDMTPAAIARQIVAGKATYAEMPFGKVVSQVARGLLSLAEPGPASGPEPAAPVEEPGAAESVDDPAAMAEPAQGNAVDGGEAAAEDLAASLTEAVAETAANRSGDPATTLIEAFEEGGGGLDIEA